MVQLVANQLLKPNPPLFLVRSDAKNALLTRQDYSAVDFTGLSWVFLDATKWGDDYD